MRRLLSASLLILASPVVAQTVAQETPVWLSRVDAAVVGTWELAEVEDGGIMDALGAEIEALVLRVEADGDATMALEVLQDQETVTREDAFHCTAQNGRIEADNRPAIGYEVLSEDEIRLTDPKGVVVRMKRAEEATDTASTEVAPAETTSAGSETTAP